MRTFPDLFIAATAGAAVVLLSACSGASTQGTGLMPAGLARVHPDRAWISPEGKAAKKLLYVSENNTAVDYVNIYSYPKEKLVGQIITSEGPEGMCVDAAGDVFVPQRHSGDIYEFAHGGTTPIATLNDGVNGGSCSVDPTTGNLAVGNIASTFAIFPYDGSEQFGSPVTYTAPYGFTTVNDVGYDNEGNLFLQGSDVGTNITGWLPKGSANPELLKLSVSIGSPGAVQWDGKYITFTDRSTGDIYEVSVSGTSGTVVGSVLLNVSGDDRDSWISTALHKVFVPQYTANELLVFKYPSGKPLAKKTISNLDSPWGTTISIAK